MNGIYLLSPTLTPDPVFEFQLSCNSYEYETEKMFLRLRDVGNGFKVPSDC